MKTERAAAPFNNTPKRAGLIVCTKNTMKNKFTIHDENVEEFPSKTAPGGKGTSRRVILLDASKDSKPMAQFWELNLPGEHPEIGKGKTVEVEIHSIDRIFSGRPQIRGAVLGLPPAAK